MRRPLILLTGFDLQNTFLDNFQYLHKHESSHTHNQLNLFVSLKNQLCRLVNLNTPASPSPSLPSVNRKFVKKR